MELIGGQPLNAVIKSFSKQNMATVSPTQFAAMLRTTVSEPLLREGIDPSEGAAEDDSGSDAIESSTAGRRRIYYNQAAR